MPKAKQSHRQRLAAGQRRREEERRRVRSRRRRQVWVTLGVVALVVAAGVVLIVRVTGGGEPEAAAAADPAAQDAEAPEEDAPPEGARLDAPTAPAEVACGGTVPPRNEERPTFDAAPEAAVEAGTTYATELVTSCGAFTIELAADTAPVNVTSFLELARSGFYDGTWFHRIVPGGDASIGVIQGGDPEGSGIGGPGYELPDELPEGDAPYPQYSVAMANAGPDTGGSQFFVNTQDNSELLGPDFTVIGTVTEGRDVIDRIAAEVPVEGETPAQAVWIEQVTVTES